MNNELKESDFLNLVNDIDFERIDLGLRSVNIFDILKVTRAEIRHSNFLGWLLNPDESHGLNEIVLVRFLRTIFSDSRAIGLNSLEADSLDFSKVEIRREWQSIDLLVVVDNIVICVENKFDSIEHSNQLKRYFDIVSSSFPEYRKVFILLTPLAQSAQNESEIYIEYSYQQISELLERILLVFGEALSDKVASYIKDYIQVLKRTIMQTDELNALAERLYKNHRATLDFIFENRPDTEQRVRKLFHKKIEDSGLVLGSIHKGYARFLTPNLDAIIPRYSYANGWPKKEAFLFEIDFYWYKKDLVFKSVISPGDEEIMNILSKIISKVEGAIKPMGKKWICHFIIKSKFDMEKISELTDEEINDRINQLWSPIESIVNKIETAILEDGRIAQIAEK